MMEEADLSEIALVGQDKDRVDRGDIIPIELARRILSEGCSVRSFLTHLQS